MVTVSIITPMSKRLHCCYRVLFVMFLAPNFATDISILFTSDCPYYMSKSFVTMCPCLDCKCHLHVYKNGWMQYLSQEIPKSLKKIRCCICSNGYHMKCITLCPDYIHKLTEEMNNWYCPTCLSCLFLYNLISDENDFISAITDISGESHQSFCYLSDKLFMSFELNDKDHSSALCDIDPDLHFYQDFNQATVKCNYYLETKFNDEISEPNETKDVLSLCHVNIRSAKKSWQFWKLSEYFKAWFYCHRFILNLAERQRWWFVWTMWLQSHRP